MPPRLLHIFAIVLVLCAALFVRSADRSRAHDAGFAVDALSLDANHRDEPGVACADESHDHNRCDCGCDDCDGPGCFDCGCDHGIAAAGLPVDLGVWGHQPAPDRVGSMDPQRPRCVRPAPPLQPPRATQSA